MREVQPSAVKNNPPEIEHALNELIRGRTNALGSVTLAAGAATTVVNDRRVSATSHVFFSPETATAATEFGAGQMYVSARVAKTSFTITHRNTADADRTFAYLILSSE